MTTFDLGCDWGVARLVPFEELRRTDAEAVAYASDGVALAWSPGRIRLAGARFACDVERADQPISEQLLASLGCLPGEAVRFWTRLETTCKLCGMPVVEAVLRGDQRRQLFDLAGSVRLRTAVLDGKVCSFGVGLSGRSSACESGLEVPA